MATYAFRIRFHREPSYPIESDLSETNLGERGPRLIAEKGKSFRMSTRLKLIQGGFGSPEVARAEGERWFDALMVAGLREQVGLDLGRFRLGGGVTLAGEAYFSELVGSPIRNDFHGLDVYEEQDGQKFLSMDVEARVPHTLEATVAEIVAARQEDVELPARLRLALELFGVARFASAPRILLLTLISAVEAVKEQEQVPGAKEVVDAWEDSLTGPLAKDPSFLGRLRDLKKESISQACQRVVAVHLGGADVKTFKRLYNVRSTLVHEGTVEDNDFVADASTAQGLVWRLLCNMVKAVKSPPIPESPDAGRESLDEPAFAKG